MSRFIGACDSLKTLARLELEKRKPHVLCDDYWQDGQIRTTPQKWLFDGQNLDIMKLSDAAQMVLLNYENGQVVGSRMSGKIDEICIRFVDFDENEHKSRLDYERKFFCESKQHLFHNKGVKDVCNAKTFFRVNPMCMPHVLQDGTYVPSRTLWVEVCTLPKCAYLQTCQLKDLDMIQLYPAARKGCKVTVIQSGKTVAYECLGAVFDFVRLEQRKIAKLEIINLTKEICLSNLESTLANFMKLFEKDRRLIYSDKIPPKLMENDFDLAGKFFNEQISGKIHFDHEIRSVGTHLPGEYETSKYVTPVYGDISQPVDVDWYDRRSLNDFMFEN